MFDEPQGTDQNHERALEKFNRHPARALSARELGIMLDEDSKVAQDYLDELETAGFIAETNERDGQYVRYRLVND